MYRRTRIRYNSRMTRFRHRAMIALLALAAVTVGAVTLEAGSAALSGVPLSARLIDATNTQCADDCQSRRCGPCEESRMECVTNRCIDDECRAITESVACAPEGPECVTDADCPQPAQVLGCVMRRGTCQHETHVSTCSLGSCVQYTLYRSCERDQCAS